MRRRDLLRFVLMVVGAGVGVAAASTRPEPSSGRGCRSPRDASLAGLGARVAATQPDTARALVAEVEAMRRREREGGAEPRCLRAALLGPDARARDLARGAVLAVDGWLLTRSEVAYCVHLDRLRRPSGRSGRAKRG